MAKVQSRGRRSGAGRRAHARKTVPWRGYLAWGAVAVAAVAFVFYAVRVAGNESAADPGTKALAERSSGGEVEVMTGSRHTVYHAVAPLPDPASPRADGKPTLVWFSGTWCEFCEAMEGFAHPVAATYSDRLVFVEKSVDHDRRARSSYGVLGTPTFVLIDAAGREITRFGYQRDGAAFAAAIKASLTAATAADG